MLCARRRSSVAHGCQFRSESGAARFDVHVNVKHFAHDMAGSGTPGPRRGDCGYGPGGPSSQHAAMLAARVPANAQSVLSCGIARPKAASRCTPACSAPRLQPARSSVFQVADSGLASHGLRSKQLLRGGIHQPDRGNVPLDLMHPTWCTSSAERPPPLRGDYEDPVMGPYQGKSEIFKDHKIKHPIC